MIEHCLLKLLDTNDEVVGNAALIDGPYEPVAITCAHVLADVLQMSSEQLKSTPPELLPPNQVWAAPLFTGSWPGGHSSAKFSLEVVKVHGGGDPSDVDDFAVMRLAEQHDSFELPRGAIYRRMKPTQSAPFEAYGVSMTHPSGLKVTGNYLHGSTDDKFLRLGLDAIPGQGVPDDGFSGSGLWRRDRLDDRRAQCSVFGVWRGRIGEAYQGVAGDK